MKTKLKHFICVIFITQLLSTNVIYAQFNTAGGSNSKFGQTDANGVFPTNWIRSIGVGNFTNNGTVPQAHLHINSNYLETPQNGSILNKGRLFRTDGPSNVDNTWEMWTGGQPTGLAPSQKAVFYVPSGTSNFVIQSTQIGGNILFNTGGANERMIITDGTSSTAGFVGIGNNLLYPSQRLEVNDNLINTFIKVKNTGTTAGGIILSGGGTGAKDVIIHSTGPNNSQGAGKFITRCDSVDLFSIDLRTGSTFGFVSIGKYFTNPSARLEIKDDINTQLRLSYDLNHYSDIISNSNGDLIILPQENSIKKHVAINNSTPIASLDVRNDDDYESYIAGFFSLKNTDFNNPNIAANIGILDSVFAPFCAYSVGAIIYSSGGISNCGINVSGKGGKINTGGYFSAEGGNLNYGVTGIAYKTPSAFCAYGVLGQQGNYTYPPIAGDYAGVFFGDVWISGPTNGSGYALVSDRKLKKDTVNFINGLNVIRNIRVVSYKYNGLAGFSTDENHVGVIAQELQLIAPYAVDSVYAKLDTADIQATKLLTIKNEAIIYTAINAIKELDSSVTILQNTTPPNKPILAFPADSATDIPLTITLTWEKSERAASYTVYVNPRGVIGRDVIEESIIINTTDTFATLTLHNYFSSYNWYVVAYNSAGSSDISDQWGFTTLMPPVPDAVALVTPINSTTDLPLANTFTWNKSEYANNYTLYISTDMSYTNVVNIVNALDTIANATVPNYSTKYYWWVIASNVSGQSPESDKWEFATLVPPPPPLPPVLISPAIGDTLFGIQIQTAFNWHKSEAASFYSFYLSLTPDETGLVRNSISVDTFSIVQFLGGGDTTYYWWVTACNQYSCGDKSDVWNFYNQVSMKPTPKEIATSEATLSDSTLKTDVQNLSNALAMIEQMQAVKFYWDTINHAWLPATEQIGLIGQQVNNIAPQVVFKDSAGYYNIQYGRLVALLVEGMKEQQLQIDSLKTIVMGASQKSTGDNGNNSSQSKMQYVELATENAIILNQNDPNPFAEETDISYYLPDNVSEAKILFYDNTGKIIKTVELIGKGNGTLHVYASNLSSGIYAYALVADGKIIDTKKMVCTKK